MTRTLESHSHVLVVDSEPTGYRTLVALAQKHGWHAHFLTSGRAALHVATRLRAELWMIHVSLPDMSGFDLYEMARDHLTTAMTFMISNQYDAEEEKRACGIGAHLYLSKDDGNSVDCASLLNPLLASSPVDRKSYQPSTRPP